MTAIYGDLGRNERFIRSFARCLRTLWAQGTSATLQDYLTRTR
jgi:hypothetical protein